ncbi:RIP metalloprotease [Deinococcus sp.]|uniref:M50 family metallopeptidase n=1 Tax=Deinococcus sp. TaxID=47478 RepID=UPI0025C15158|nr:M50 family metallopeptidase [Deinococcus sp.]
MSFFSSMAAVMTPLGILWTVIILSVATFLHELAHYALARRQGVAVKSFSVGMGPVLSRVQWKGTEWRISALPIGGYVEIDGMAPVEGADGQFHAPTAGYVALSTWGKIAVILAGPVMNLLLAIGLMTALGSTTTLPAPATISVLAGSKAQKLGLRSGDTITRVNGRALPATELTEGGVRGGWNDITATLKTDGHHTFTVQRGGQSRELAFDWKAQVGGQRHLLGISPKEYRVFQASRIPQAFVTSLQVTAQAVPQVLKAFGNLFARFLTLNISQDQNVSGPIGTAEIISRAAALSPWALVQVAIMLNLSLAFFNLLPIPGLDGGRILLALLGAIKGSPLSFSQEQAINFAGFAFVMLLTAFVVLRDLSRFF